MKIKHIVIISIFVPLLFLCAGCGKVEYSSLWKNKEIIIDGKDNEWQNVLVEKDKVFLGAMNDKDNLYVCVSTEDKGAKSQLLGMFGQTVTLWFYCPGGEDKKIGVRFKNGNDSNINSRPSNMDEAFNLFQSKINNYEIVNTGGSAQPISTNNTFEIKTGYLNNKLVLEMKMPLIIQSILNSANANNKQITFGLETSEMELKNTEKKEDPSTTIPQNGGMGMGGGGGGRGRGGSHGGGRHSGGGISFPGRLQTSITINLAAEPKTSIAVSTVTSKSTETIFETTPAATNAVLIPQSDTTFIVNVPNSKGGATSVIIKKVQGGFTGPQGEFYSESPSIEQLKVMYGN